jgi:hypothetical protein
MVRNYAAYVEEVEILYNVLIGNFVAKELFENRTVNGEHY